MFISTEQSERDSATAYRKSLPSPLIPPTRNPGSPVEQGHEFSPRCHLPYYPVATLLGAATITWG